MTSPDSGPIAQELRQFIVDTFLYGKETEDLVAEASFLDRGIVDSTGVLELVGFLESRFGITVADDELVPENLDSLIGLEAFVHRKTSHGNARAR